MQQFFKNNKIKVNGRDLDVMLVLYPGKSMTAPEIWEHLRSNESDHQLKIMLAASCGGVYAAVGLCCRRNWIEEDTPTETGVRRYKLTKEGLTVSHTAIHQFEDRLSSLVGFVP